jgi:serine O-acetyltransferase
LKIYTLKEMANNLRTAWTYIQSDYVRYFGKRPTFFNALTGLMKQRCFNYCFWFRLSQRKNFFWLPAKIMHKHYSNKYQIKISSKTQIGYGLYLGHGIAIVINSSATIGNNCNLSQFTTIGSNHEKAATIGDNVYIGPSVCIVEDVKIGDNVSIGAGSVVVKDIPENATVAGVPAKILNFNNPGRYIKSRWLP